MTVYLSVLVGIDDFDPSPINLTFQPTMITGAQECRELLIVNDLVVEETDEFIVFLNSSDEGVMIGLSSTIVAIVDNDSEYADAL